MKKLLIILAFASCKESKEKKPKWKVEYIVSYKSTFDSQKGTVRVDSCIYFIGNCCPFVDTAYAYEVGDTVNVEKVIKNTLIEYRPYRLKNILTLDMGEIEMEKDTSSVVDTILNLRDNKGVIIMTTNQKGGQTAETINN